MATVISQPISDQNVNWTPSTAGSHYVLVDEGMARPLTSDYVYTTIANTLELYGFNPTDNGEQIVSVNFRYYASGSIGGSPYFALYLADGIGGTYQSADLIPAKGIFKENSVELTTNPITSAPWTFQDLQNYDIGFKSVAGDGFDTIIVATHQIDITTEPAGSLFAPHAAI